MGSAVDLSVNLGTFSLANPVLAASGTFGYGLEFTPFVDLNRIGGFCTKGLSLKPRMGNPAPRVVETAAGMLNSIGLENVGFDRFRDEKLPHLQMYDCRVVCNFFGDTVGEYEEMARALSTLDRVDALEMNISCPNVEEGGVQFSADPKTVEKVVGATRRSTDKFLIVKLSPNVTDITVTAKAAEAAGADALSLVNTYVGMVLDAETAEPYLGNGNGTGGLSGPAIKPIALNMVYQTSRAVTIPVIGLGGIRTAEDAIEYILAGASAIQVGTANFFDPRATMNILDGLTDWCRDHGIDRIESLRGRAWKQ
ncbi:dihydroorotate dehydrogenase [Nitrospina sp. 32_T5]|uniref:dihydroorotate dehydrogenase n=1 Tax=unclassified Nitrospina TaxID=2638683 RepID=UPI003F9B06E4